MAAIFLFLASKEILKISRLLWKKSASNLASSPLAQFVFFDHPSAFGPKTALTRAPAPAQSQPHIDDLADERHYRQAPIVSGSTCPKEPGGQPPKDIFRFFFSKTAPFRDKMSSMTPLSALSFFKTFLSSTSAGLL
jgi:hypothetical protein